jgi:hypothetical protein
MVFGIVRTVNPVAPRLTGIYGTLEHLGPIILERFSMWQAADDQVAQWS